MRKSAHGQTRLSLFEYPAFYFRKIKVAKLIKPCDLVIDEGCGFHAPLLKWLLENYKIKQAIGIDLLVEQNSYTEKLHYLKADLNQPINLPDSLADYIISLAVLEHLENPQTNLREIYRLLKYGGKLILTTPTPLAKPVLEFLSYKLNLINQEEVRDHKNYFNEEKLKDLLMTAGFKSERIMLKKFLLNLNNLVIAEK